MALDLRRFIERFTGEARDHLAGLERGLADLAEHPDDLTLVDALFRSAHTIKGSARMLKLSGVSATAHHMEDLLAALRDARVRPAPAGIGLLLRGVDAITAQLERIAVAGGDPPADPDLCAALARAAGAEPGGGPPAATGHAPDPPPAAVAAAATALLGPGAPVAPPAAPPTGDAATRARIGQFGTRDSVRVPLARLDELLGLFGELNRAHARQRQRLAQARALERAARAGTAASLAPALRALVAGLREDLKDRERLAEDLHERALALRLLPLATVFDPAVRMVRELARAAGKEVRCEVSGADLEVDRGVIAGLGEALVQVLRNAVDHGLEDPEGRRAAGKAECGSIRIRARHARRGVEVEIADDGRGLSRERILARAIQRGLLDAARAVALSDAQVWDLIFVPGLSTSEHITDISGRGVGMDVIRRTIAGDLNGSLTLESRPGAGTRIVLVLPRSLALMRVLLCECAGLSLGLPAQHVVELHRCTPAATISLAGQPAVVLRNEFIPLIPLAEVLGPLPATAGPPGGGHAGAPAPGNRLAVVLGVRQAKVGFLVDRVQDEQPMLVRALPQPLRGCPGMLAAGLVVTDDDRLVSVLSASALLEAARRQRGAASVAGEGTVGPHPTRSGNILVVDDSQNTREIVKEVLEAYGYRVTTAEDGLKGWQQALGGGYDAVLTDVEMPGLDGFALTARLRANPHYQATPIVIVSSRASEADRRRGVAAGADAYIVKGDFDQSGLLATLASLLGEGGPGGR